MPWSRDLTLCLAVTWFQSISTHPLLITKLLTEPLQASCYCYPHFFCTDSDTISHTSALALSKAEVLCVLQSQSQAACLMAGLQEKTTYRSTPFLSGDSRAKNILQWKATGGARSGVVRETAGWMRPNPTLGTSTLASTGPLLCDGSPPSLYCRGLSSLCGGDSRRSRRNFR